MKIYIDKDVFNFLQSKAKAYIETPNDTLRRLFGLDSNIKSEEVFSTENINRKKSPKTNLNELIRVNLICDGQKLYFLDYKSNRVENEFAIVTNNKLKYKGSLYSMSNLAQRLLVENEYKDTKVRGPKHWETEEGITIMELWAKYLKNKENKL